MPTGAYEIPIETIREIVESVPPGAGTFLLTAVTSAEHLVQMARDSGANTLQLWDPLEPLDYARIRLAMPRLSIVQTIHVLDGSALNAATEAARMADALVLDSANPDVPFRWELQSGRTHDWEISREIVELVDCPVLLAGGLNEDNVRYAVQVVRPYGVDVCSSVRTEDRLDQRKVVDFLEALRREP